MKTLRQLVHLASNCFGYSEARRFVNARIVEIFLSGRSTHVRRFKTRSNDWVDLEADSSPDLTFARLTAANLHYGTFEELLNGPLPPYMHGHSSPCHYGLYGQLLPNALTQPNPQSAQGQDSRGGAEVGEVADTGAGDSGVGNGADIGAGDTGASNGADTAYIKEMLIAALRSRTFYVRIMRTFQRVLIPWKRIEPEWSHVALRLTPTMLEVTEFINLALLSELTSSTVWVKAEASYKSVCKKSHCVQDSGPILVQVDKDRQK